MKSKLILCCLAALLSGSAATAQIPVEFFAGHERATADVMFFRFFKKSDNTSSRWLFFNRSRAAVDYRITSTAFLPQFGLTNALSWNHARAKGFAPVLVGQVLYNGVYAKAGVQYAWIKNNTTVFSWFVSEIGRQPVLDYFLLVRYTPPLTKKLNLFTQFESINALPLEKDVSQSFVLRLRLGVDAFQFQFGAGTDLSFSGRQTYSQHTNAGVFIRHSF
ncbi:MAG: hypothetical protein MUC87_05870 [Bacteroidia bacterium]|jgi:hypothetical protein|nr:hypothetical protein [Bacteroidia bacterium]